MDGFPDGQGLACLTFLRNELDLDRLKTALRNSYYATDDQVNGIWQRYGADSSGLIAPSQAKLLVRDYPQLDADMGAKILPFLQNHEDGVMLENSLTFAADGSNCEWVYLIDLDSMVYECYQGFNEQPLCENDRFYFLKDYEEGEYHGAKLVGSFSLNNLPKDDEFMAVFDALLYEDEGANE